MGWHTGFDKCFKEKEFLHKIIYKNEGKIIILT